CHAVNNAVESAIAGQAADVSVRSGMSAPRNATSSAKAGATSAIAATFAICTGARGAICNNPDQAPTLPASAAKASAARPSSPMSRNDGGVASARWTRPSTSSGHLHPRRGFGQISAERALVKFSNRRTLEFIAFVQERHAEGEADIAE